MMEWSRVHNAKAFSAMTIILTVFSMVYRLAIWLRIRLHRSSKEKVLPGFVTSIGNLTVGGTGKTPAAHMIAEWASEQGYRAAILSRGYGGLNKKEVLEVTDGNSIYTTPEESGDEPFLLAKKLNNVQVIISRNRYKAGMLAHNKFGANFFILDDGFQHINLKRDLDLLLIDSANPLGNGHLLPWGPLREPVEQIKRADAVIITRCIENSTSGETDKIISEMVKDKPVFRSNHVPFKIVFPGKGEDHNPDFIKKRRVVAFAGIARPEEFRKTLTDLGAELLFFQGFRDHHFISINELNSLGERAKKLNADCIVTTEKDWVRIEKIAHKYTQIAYLSIRFKFINDEDGFFQMIKNLKEAKDKES